MLAHVGREIERSDRQPSHTACSTVVNTPSTETKRARMNERTKHLRLLIDLT